VELYRNMNLSCLFTNTTRQVYSKATETILNYVEAPSFYQDIEWSAHPGRL